MSNVTMPFVTQFLFCDQQLFGDTMNTAARMESTGKRNKIQLSPETAALLKEADKEHWLELRSDIIVAKGKGALQTYWLTPDARGKVEESTPQEESGAEKLDPKTEAELKAKKAKEMKEQRLVDWNCELLLQSLKKIVAQRNSEMKRRHSKSASSKYGVKIMEKKVGDVGQALSEVQEIIALPENAGKTSIEGVDLGEEVPKQLRQYVALLASMYKENSFHCFEVRKRHSTRVRRRLKFLDSSHKFPLVYLTSARLACDHECVKTLVSYRSSRSSESRGTKHGHSSS